MTGTLTVFPIAFLQTICNQSCWPSLLQTGVQDIELIITFSLVYMYQYIVFKVLDNCGRVRTFKFGKYDMNWSCFSLFSKSFCFLRSNGDLQRPYLSCCGPCRLSPALKAPSLRTHLLDLPVWSPVSATWK